MDRGRGMRKRKLSLDEVSAKAFAFFAGSAILRAACDLPNTDPAAQYCMLVVTAVTAVTL